MWTGIGEINEKDMKDMMSIFMDYEISDTDTNALNGTYLTKLVSDDWGLYKTFTMNLDKLLEKVTESDFDAQQKEVARSRIEKLRKMFETSPKSLTWKLREKVGENVRWYELPEVDKEVVDSRMKNPDSDQMGQSSR